MNARRLMGLPKAKDDGLTIAGQGRASQQKRIGIKTTVTVDSVRRTVS